MLRRRPSHLGSDAPLIDRIQPPRDYPPPRDYTYRGDYPPRYPAPGDPRYYDYPAPPRREAGYARPPSPPPRDYRDYPPQPPARSTRDYDDYRMRSAPQPPTPRLESRGYYADTERVPPPGYPRGYPPTRDYYDNYDRRGGAPPSDRYGSYPAPASARPRTPPGVPPRARDDYDRPPRYVLLPATSATMS